MDQILPTSVPKSTPKDVFYYLLSIVTLYMSAISFISLLFQLVGYWFPDPQAVAYGANQTIRWASAILIVSFPVYLFLMWLINKDITADPSRREVRVRKWLGYLTLFISAIVSIVDVGTLVYNLLGGELAARVILKILVVLVVAASVFFYYLRELRSTRELGPSNKILAWIVSIVVLASIVVAFVVVGSPTRQRKLNFDSTRVNNLAQIQSEIQSYYARTNTLPSNLASLTQGLSPIYVPKDPETGADYEYIVKNNLSFQLCATFDLPSEANQNYRTPAIYPYSVSDNWSHGPGRVCFDRTANPQLDKPPMK